VDVFYVVYLDDILIFSESEAEHDEHLRQVLERLRKYSLYTNPKKCDFYYTSVDFLGFRITTDGISIDPERVVAILE